MLKLVVIYGNGSIDLSETHSQARLLRLVKEIPHYLMPNAIIPQMLKWGYYVVFEGTY